MAEFPALPLFTDAILADCSHLSDAEMGRYIRILMLMWRAPNCRIPNDEVWLARKFGRTVEIYAKEIKPLLKEFCKSTGNWYTQKRLMKEFKYVRGTSKKQSVRAKARWNNDKDSCRGNAPTPHPTHTPPTGEENTSLPPKLSTGKAGVLKIVGGVKYDIVARLSDRGLAAAKAAAPDWDIYFLAGIYNDGVSHAKRGGPPNKPDQAFAGWCAKYTKGRRP